MSAKANNFIEKGIVNDMRYIKIGNGEKVLIIIPGVGVEYVTDAAQAIADRFHRDDYTVYLFDRKNTPPDTYTMINIAEDTYASINMLGITKASFYGASQGGAVVLCIAATHPELVEKIVICSSGARPVANAVKNFKHWQDVALTLDGGELADAIAKTMLSKKSYDAYKDVLIANGIQYDAAGMKRFAILDDSLFKFDIRDMMDKIKCPALIVDCEGDRVFWPEASRELHELIKGSELYMYGDEYGHACYDEAPDFTARLFEFLDR